MEKFKFCSNCGSKVLEGDRFCSNCGRDALQGSQEQGKDTGQEVKGYMPKQNQQRQGPNQNQSRPQPSQGQKMNPNMYRQGPGAPRNSNTGLIVAICAIIAMLIIGSGIFAFLSLRTPKGDAPPISNSGKNEDTSGGDSSKTEQEKPGKVEEGSNQPELDLSKARTYLSEPGIKATFFVNYPDGMSGVLDRISSSAVPDPSIAVTEVEVGIDMGQEYGYATHYVERGDGTYTIYDDSPYEVMPVLKNDLYLGKTWEYVGGYGNIVWTVSNMDVRVDLGFKVFENCIVVKEDNQAVGFQSLTYYAPGYGIVRVVDPGGAMEYYRMTALEEIGEEAASQAVVSWAPNYRTIKDDKALVN